MDKKYQLGDLRTLGTVFISTAILFGIGAYIVGSVGKVFNTSTTGTDNASKIMNYGTDSLITSSQFFVVVGLVVVAGIVIGLISRAM